MFDNALVVTLGSFAALAAAYLLYGRFLARHVFQLSPDRRTPAHELEDGVDYVPTGVPVLFGHHFASIAGLGPILGPAIAVIWGWVPAVIWVLVGSIFLGAVHDLGSLTVSLRFQGRSIGDACRDLIGPRARILFLLIIFFLMSLAMGAFVNAISSLFVAFNPDAIIPSFGLMLVAMAIGVAVYKLRVGLGPATAVGLLAFGGLIYWGVQQPVPTYRWQLTEETRRLLDEGQSAGTFAAPYGSVGAVAHLKTLETAAAEEAIGDVNATVATSKTRWIFVLLAYGFVASVLPVWLLLQPRDYINSFQLYLALLLLVVGLGVAALTGAPEGRISAEPIRQLDDAPPMWPFLLVTIACGAVSGFHSLVSSGTTVRQLNRETDALPIGFGAMLTEGALAILVIMACVAGLGESAWSDGGTYASWRSGIGGSGLGGQLSAVVTGGANFFAHIGIPTKYGQAFLAVTIVAFAMTTLDSATRLLRFNVEEIFRSLNLEPLANRYIASLVAVLGISFFGLSEGGRTLWVLFGATNQLLAGLALLTVTIFLYKLSRAYIYTLVPMVIMFTVSIWAMLYLLLNEKTGYLWFTKNGVVNSGRLGLCVVSITVLTMTVWLIVEAAIVFARGPGGLAFDDEDGEMPDDETSKMAKTTHLG